MNKITIGVRLESLDLPLRRALEQAERLGVAGVQVDAVGDLAPRSLSQTGRREFKNLLRTHNLALAALGCPLRHGLDNPENLEPRIDHIRQTMQLSFDLGPRIVLIQPGQIPAKEDDSAMPLLQEALQALSQFGDRIGCIVALETGLESGEMLNEFLSHFDTGSLGVNLDPANLLMHDFDPLASARALGSKVVYSQAKDVRRVGPSRTAQEVPLGHGDIDWMAYLSVLEEIEYRGWITVLRDSGGNRLSDLAAGVAFLKRFVGNSD
ncbi:MAG TPA: sugar phosphate isomerase/epimerase family protein [Gemmataceae bacterium]|jgi:sugar phosphate isomerase/epimerase|nr:sugar phosphate isomerase/epimerase family protein [Gemmataceae bacterium]